MSQNTRDTICATIGLVIVILLLTTVAALDEPVMPDTPPAAPQAALPRYRPAPAHPQH